MKKLNNSTIENINGGAKCIYHILGGALISTFPLGPIIDYFWGGNGAIVTQCLNNSHHE